MFALINNKYNSLISKLSEITTKTVLIHIGKCGGSTVVKELKRKNIKFTEKHICKVKFNKTKDYIIVIRNPISRYISAYNWRYKLVIQDKVQENRFEGEKTHLEKYKTANQLAESIYDSNGNQVLDFQNRNFYIHHLKEDINYYIGDLLNKCKPENIKVVIATETLNDDMYEFFNIRVTSHEKKNAKNKDQELSELAYRNLKKYLIKDYDCIDLLREMNKISDSQYEILSK